MFRGSGESLPSSLTRVTVQDWISSSRGRRDLTAFESEAWRRCVRSLVGKMAGRKGDVKEVIRHVNWRGDCSIGATNTLCRAEAVLNAHLELLILAIAVPGVVL